MKPIAPPSLLFAATIFTATLTPIAAFSPLLAAKLLLALNLILLCYTLGLHGAGLFSEALENIALYQDSKTYDSIHSFSSVLFWTAIRSVAKFCALGLGVFLSLCSIWHIFA